MAKKKVTRRKRYRASVYPDHPVPSELGMAIADLESDVEMPVWVMIQSGGPYGAVNDLLLDAFQDRKSELSEPIALLLVSPGGDARCAFSIARFLRRHCGGFKVLVPGWAKSAATLLALGATEIIIGSEGELGPLDAQMDDPEREHRISVLDKAQSLERLNAFALRAIDQTMHLLVSRTGMKVATLMPQAMTFVTELLKPMMSNIDPVEYAEMWRLLRVAQDYAHKLLLEHYDPVRAETIAERLVSRYAEHTYPIDAEEAESLGIEITRATESQNAAFDKIRKYMDGVTIFGQITEILT